MQTRRCHRTSKGLSQEQRFWQRCARQVHWCNAHLPLRISEFQRKSPIRHTLVNSGYRSLPLVWHLSLADPASLRLCFPPRPCQDKKLNYLLRWKLPALRRKGPWADAGRKSKNPGPHPPESCPCRPAAAGLEVPEPQCHDSDSHFGVA